MCDWFLVSGFLFLVGYGATIIYNPQPTRNKKHGTRNVIPIQSELLFRRHLYANVEVFELVVVYDVGRLDH